MICGGHYIKGRIERGRSEKFFKNIDPATEEEICVLQEASPEEVDETVLIAEHAFSIWKNFSGKFRGEVLQKAAKIIRDRAEELAMLEVRDTGKPLSEALSVDIPSAAEVLEYFAGVAPTLHGSYVDLPPSFAYVKKEPLGVCCGIGAWNYPLQIAAWKAAPALACGNAMIFKPSEWTPSSAVVLAEILSIAGAPEGLFNVLQGSDELGKYLVSHPGIRKVSLTGSVETGKAVMREAATNLKRVSLELGGKSPLILFADCDLDQAVSAALMANYYTQGEVCSNGTRVFVEEGIHEAFIHKIIPRLEKIKASDPKKPDCNFGAMISKEHMERVQSYIQKGIEEGARCYRFPFEVPKKGYFLQPVLFDGCTDDMTIVKEEIFGPVMSVLSFRTEDEVIQRANNCEFGLSAGVFTQNISRAHRLVSKLEAGVCWINNYNLTPIELPFGGVKSSGMGRENGLEAIENYTQSKTVFVEMGEVESTF